MPHQTPATKSLKGQKNEASTAPSAGPRGIVLRPPHYGIEFVDRATEGEGPLQLMPRLDRRREEQEIAPVLSRDRSSLAPNRTGLPDQVKAGIESLSGFDMSDVRVHYNSSEPAALQALAYTQGTDIHVAPGQERHLPHEAWHVVQQKQGRVQPRFQLKGEQINDDQGLEHEAEVMGGKAAGMRAKSTLLQSSQDRTSLNELTSQLNFSVATPIPTAHTQTANIVQRLVYTQKDQELHVPRSYADLPIPWDDVKKYSVEREPKSDDPTLESLYKANADSFNGYIGAGIDQTVAAMKSHQETTNDLGQLILPMVGEQKRSVMKQTRDALLNAFRSHRQYLLHYPNLTYWSPDEVLENQKWAMLPRDYIPQEPDLPEAGTSLRSNMPGTTMNETWWEYACVLIALVKQEGYAKVNQITQKTVNSLDSAVQALHDYYKAQHVPLEYDDSSTRTTLMKEWGYELIFTGPSSFQDLPQHIELKSDQKYIFDITGHTVKVVLRRNMPKTGQSLRNVGEYFEFHSEQDNYSKDESTQQVLYIFVKS